MQLLTEIKNFENDIAVINYAPGCLGRIGDTRKVNSYDLHSKESIASEFRKVNFLRCLAHKRESGNCN